MQRSDHDKSPEGGNDSDAPSPQKHSATALHQPGLAAESLQPLRACSAQQGGFCGSVGQFGWQGGYMSFIRPPAVREGYWFSCVKMHCYTASPLQLAE